MNINYIIIRDYTYNKNVNNIKCIKCHKDAITFQLLYEIKNIRN